MKTIVVDDEKWMLVRFEQECKNIPDVELVGSFDQPESALEFVRANPVNLAFLDAEMPVMTGIELSRKLREVRPDIVIIFISAYDDYMKDAFINNADYYILKPYTTQQLVDAVKRAKLLSKRQESRVFIRTFGNFDVFVDGKPIEFKSYRSKELLAYLVDRCGSVVTTAEGFAVLWEDAEYSHESAGAYRQAILRLKASLEQAGISEIMVDMPKGKAVDNEKFDCDYYRFLNGDKEAINSFRGEYMTQYSWAETTLGALYAQSEFFKTDY